MNSIECVLTKKRHSNVELREEEVSLTDDASEERREFFVNGSDRKSLNERKDQFFIRKTSNDERRKFFDEETNDFQESDQRLTIE